MQTLEEYNVVRNYVLNIRAEFAREYMPKTSKIIELQDSDGNKWNVRCIRRKNHLCLSKGWTKFVRDKSLVVGDVCVFELIKDIQTNKLILKVYIFRSREEEKLLEDSSLTKHQNMETPAYSAQQGSKNKILQLNERKHMGSPDTSRPASSNRTNCMSDTDKSVTDQQLEKPIRRGRPRKSDRRRRGRPRKTDQPSAAEVNRATSSAKRFRPKNPNFTQTLGEYNVVQNYLLNIPAEFVREYMPKTSETIELQDSDGNKWNVHCLMRKDQLCLSEGWRKFVRDRSLAVGDVCVFELINDIQTDKLMLKVHINRSREKGNLLEDSSLTKPAGGKLLHQNMETPVYSAQQGSKHKILQLDERKHMGSPDASRPLSSNGTNCMSDTSKSFTGQQLEKPIRRGRLKSEQPRAAEENRAIKAAKMFRSKNPYFMRILEKYNVERFYVLNIPAKFVQEYLQKTSEVIKLQDSDGNNWNAHCIRRKYDMVLRKGWLNFVKYNSLMVGDACVFELIKDLQADELMLKVHIYRSRVEENLPGNSIIENLHEGKLVQQKMETSEYSAQEGSRDETLQLNENTSKSLTGPQLEKCVRRGRPCRSEPPRAAEGNRAIKAAKMFRPKNPYFMQILIKYNVERIHVLIIPAEFVQEYMPKTSDVIKLQDSDGNNWNAHCIRRKYDMFLSKGWVNFVKDNSLMAGDACVFELIKDLQADELMLKVHIFRSKVEENSTNLHACSRSEPKVSIGKDCILQFSESKHTESSDAFEAVSSKITNYKTDASKSFTGQQLEKSARHLRPHKRGNPSAAEANRAISAAKRFIPENPNFMHTLGEYNIVQHYILNIPGEFTREYMPKTSKVIELQDSDGNKWNVRCIRRKGQLCLSKGWRNFVRDKSLAVGDVCVFESIKDIQTDELMLKVHIFRSTVEENLTTSMDALVAHLNQLSIGE